MDRVVKVGWVVALGLIGGCAAGGPSPLVEEWLPSAGTGSALPPTTFGGAGTSSLPPSNVPSSPVLPPSTPPSIPPSGVAGAMGVAGSTGVAGSMGVAGMSGVAGTGSVLEPGEDPGNDPGNDPGGQAGTNGGVAGSTPPVVMGDGECCADGNCLCHGPDPSMLTSREGPFRYDTFELGSGSVYYPTDAEPPFAAVAVCAGFLNTGVEMLGWGSFYASHGIVAVITWTLGSDIPDIRAIKLSAALEELKAEAAKSGNPLNGKLSDRFGTSGYSMGGGGTTIAASGDPTLRTSVGLAAWGPVGRNVQVPTLFLCGESDGVAPCYGSEDAYRAMPESTPKMVLTIPFASHLAWFGPRDAGSGASGAAALAFQKVFLEGDERWLPLLKGMSGNVTTNIQ